MEPGAGGRPVSLDGGGSDFHDLGNFLEGEASKVAEFHDPALSRVYFTEIRKGIIEGYHVHVFSAGRHHGILKCDFRHIGAAFCGTVAPGIINKNLAHELGRDGKEVVAALPLRAAHASENPARA